MKPASTRLQPDFIPDPDFERLKARLIARTGHFYYQDKDALLWERLRRRLHETGLSSTAAYLERLDDPARGEAEWAALEAEITIGETFFFRYAEQFAALRQTILPDILARRREERRLRIWSAGCASGAEPYSVAILLRRLLGPELARWRPYLLGTDLNEAVLRIARGGLFSRWALRGLTAGELARDFLPGPDGRSWLLRPEHRSMVRFERHNLMSLLDGTSPLQITEFDLILCRNVLIYFHPEVVEQVVRALAERLLPGGWLLLGHAEPNPAYASVLETVNLPGTLAYRRPEAGRAPARAIIQPGFTAEAPPPLPLPVVAPPPPPAPAYKPPAPIRTPPAPPGPATPAPSGPAMLRAVRERADAGDLEGARRSCQAALALHPTDAALHFYDGVIARARGEADAAERAFRKAIYLKGDFILAYYQLGLLLLDEGRRGAGRRALAAASRIALGLPDDALLDEGDGMTARHLRDNARLYLDATETDSQG